MSKPMTVVYERRVKDSGKTLFDMNTLEEHAKIGLPIPVDDLVKPDDAPAGSRKQYLPREKLTTMPQLFQPRDFDGQEGDRHGHIQDILDAINRSGVDCLDPVIVWWSGKQWIVVDGAHRLIAIDRFNAYLEKKGRPKTDRITMVPVSVNSGSLSEVLDWTTLQNGKSHLPLTAKQRSNWAWRIGTMHYGGIIAGDFKPAQRARTMHISRRTLTTMKKAFENLEEQWKAKHDGEPMPRSEVMKLAEMTWSQAERMSRGEADEQQVFDEEARREQVGKIAEKLIRALGKTAFTTSKAGMVAEALLQASSKFPALSLGSEEWTAAIAEALERTGEDYVPDLYAEGDEYEDACADVDVEDGGDEDGDPSHEAFERAIDDAFGDDLDRDGEVIHDDDDGSEINLAHLLASLASTSGEPEAPLQDGVIKGTGFVLVTE